MALRRITEEHVVAIILCADAADCESVPSEPGREQDKWRVYGDIERTRHVVVVTVLNKGPSLFVITAHDVTR